MIRRLLTVTAATALGVSMLAVAPAQAATADWVGPVTVESLTPTHVDLAYACTGTITYVDVRVDGDASGFAEGQASGGPVCTGEVQTHRLPLHSYSWHGNAAAAQLPVGSTASAMVRVDAGYEEFDGGTGIVSSGDPDVPATVEAGSTAPVKDMRLATKTPVAVWANNGKPFAAVWFRCDKGLQVAVNVGYVAFASGSTWSMPETSATCKGSWQNVRADLEPMGGSATAPRKGEAVSAEYTVVATPHLMTVLENRSMKAF